MTLFQRIKSAAYNSPFHTIFSERQLNLFFQIAGHAFFAAMFLWAWIYFKERMLPFDNAFYCFKIIHFKEVTIENGRFGAVLSQLLPLFALKQGCSLETFMKLYSVSFVLLNYIFYILIQYVIKNKYAAIALLLSLCLGYRYAFYYSASEVHQAVAPVILLWSLISTPYSDFNIKRKITIAICSTLIIWFISTVHILFIFPIMFALLFEWIRNPEKRKDFVLLSLIGFTIVWYGYKILSIPEDSYDASKMIDPVSFFKLLTHIGSFPSTQFFIQFFHKNYYAMGFVFLSLMLLYGLKKRIFSLLFILLSVTGFLILVLITYHKGESPVVQENYLLILGLFLSIPLSHDLIKKLPRSIAILLLVGLLSTNMYKIWKAHLLYEQRLQYLERITSYGRTFEERKFVINEQNIDWGIILSDWDMAFESLLYSSLLHPDSAVTFYTTLDPKEYEPSFADTSLLIGVNFAPFWFTSSSLDQNYFRLSNTKYVILNTDQDIEGFNESYFNRDSIAFQIEKEEHELYKYAFVTIPVIIENNSSRILPSHAGSQNPLYLAYRLYDEEGNIITAEGRRTFLEVDILPGKPYKQGVIVDLPNKRGEYIVEIDILTEHKRWWGYNRRCRIKII